MEKVKWLSKFFLKEEKPFADKRDLDIEKLMKLGGILIVLAVVLLIAWPTTVPEATVFNERRDSLGRVIEGSSDIQDNTFSQFKDSQAAARDPSRSVPTLSQLMGGDVYGGGGGGTGSGSSGSRSVGASMILMRSGFDAKTQLSQGTRIEIRIPQAMSLSSNGMMPVRGIVLRDVENESSIAIPRNSEVLGEASFDASSGRAQIIWKQLIFPDGRMRELAALGVGRDGRAGIEGKVHSGAAKETTGKVLSHFIGGFAEGSITRGQSGESEGGYQNGFKNAVSKTAQDQAESWAEDLKKTNPWMEIKADTLSVAILTEAFAFREAGSVR